MSWRHKLPAAAAAIVVATALAAGPTASANHAAPNSYLVVWAGDWNASDHSSGDLGAILTTDDAPGPDFLAVIDADPMSATYGKVVDTVTVPGAENEPHHMQYSWHPGQKIYAGGLFSDRTFVFDVDDIEHGNTSLVGVVEPLDTPCGSVPDAYWVISSGQAYGTYMGGPNAAGDPRCNGGYNNGFAGTPGTIVLINPDATVAGEFPAAGDFNSPHANDAGRPGQCLSNPPLPRSSCANPHGIQVREDLHLMVTSDYAEPRNVPISPAKPASPNLFRDTVRVWNISNPLDPNRVSVSVMPQGSMAFDPPPSVDSKGVMGIMETTVTNCTGAGAPAGCAGLHKGAFASSMCGGQIWYSGDISSANPMWRQVWDVNAAAARIDPQFETTRVQGCVGAGWIQTSPDDSLLFQAVIGREPGALGPNDPGVPHMVYALDIADLVAVPVSLWRQENDADLCSISTSEEVFGGGSESNCPSLAGAVELPDATSGGPHWGTIDNFSLTSGGKVARIAASNYFVARSGIDGNHKVCMIKVESTGALSLDAAFRDENTGMPCVGFNRPSWPHGPYGNAKPHSMLFVTP